MRGGSVTQTSNLQRAEDAAHVGNLVRSELNRQADYDLEAWIQDCVQLGSGERVLDIGCGSGKQVLAFAGLVGATGRVVGADIFGRLGELRAEAEHKLKGCGPSVELLDHDANEPFGFSDACFDAVTSAYSIYYLSDMEAVLRECVRLLAPSGRFFVVGPAWDNSREFYSLHEKITGNTLTPQFTAHLQRINDDVLPLCYDVFGQVRVSPFVNRVYFDGAEGFERLGRYYRASMLYSELGVSAEEKEQLAVELVRAARSENSDGYVMYKRALGITCRV